MAEKEEHWKKIEGASNYEISDNGRIRSLDRVLPIINNISDHRFLRGRILRQYKNKNNGYLYLRYVDDNGKKHRELSHRTIAKAFLPNPNNYGDINHINGNKEDNRVENLEWCTRSHNIQHAFAIGLSKVTEKQKELSRRKVLIIYPNGSTIVAPSVKEASKIMGYAHYNSLCLALKRKTFNKNGLTAKYL